MAKGYWVVRIDVTDPEQFKAYLAFLGPFLAAHGGRSLVRSGRQTLTEGTGRSASVVVEFDSYEAALVAYDSPDYQDGIALRSDCAIADFVIVEGLDG